MSTDHVRGLRVWFRGWAGLRVWGGGWLAGVLWGLGVWLGAGNASAAEVYRTGFEASEGYVSDWSLEGRDGWLGDGEAEFVGENGIVEGVFEGRGQQAFLGGSPQAVGAQYYSVWRPVNLAPVPAGIRWVQFSVLMSISDSTNGNWDNFYWNVYNAEGTRLCTLDFDNQYLGVYYFVQDDDVGVYTEVAFTNDVRYRLDILMDFANNVWHATLDGTVLATNQPLTVAGSALTLGDVGAGWNVFTPGVPGDNRMVFDDYEIATELLPRMTLLSKAPGGNVDGRVIDAQPGGSYALEFSDRVSGPWTALSTNTANASGTFDFVDRDAGAQARRFYRTRLLP
ncbi:MAG: hypothetical protein JXQ71_13250 [Verrucomicrobia bacterium]|nr:hypothetical protein [Verrucomicrobiota bacterium]